MGKSSKLLFGVAAGLLSFGALSILKKKIAPDPKIPTNLDDNVVIFFQRDYSPYCVKVKKIMDYKGIPYKNIDILPMLNKKFLEEVSGQNLVPVIKYKEEVISDSTRIALFLEKVKVEPSLFIKDNESLNNEIMMIEDWADEVFVKPFSKLAMLYGAEHPEIIIESKEFDTGVDLIDKNKDKVFPFMLKMMAKKYGASIDKKPDIKKEARANLDILLHKLEGKEFLVGNQLTLADITVASHLTVAQKVPYISEDDQYSKIFEWQEKIMKMTERKLVEAV
ncbi:MAG: glutathione S-transferase family protein [Cyanobacteriota bacterium]